MHELVLDAWAIMAWLKGRNRQQIECALCLKRPANDGASSR